MKDAEIKFIRTRKFAGKPFAEPFNGGLPAAFLNVSWFLSLPDADERIEAWRCHDNED
jgi:putative transposase